MEILALLRTPIPSGTNADGQQTRAAKDAVSCLYCAFQAPSDTCDAIQHTKSELRFKRFDLFISQSDHKMKPLVVTRPVLPLFVRPQAVSQMSLNQNLKSGPFKRDKVTNHNQSETGVRTDRVLRASVGCHTLRLR